MELEIKCHFCLSVITYFCFRINTSTALPWKYMSSEELVHWTTWSWARPDDVFWSRVFFPLWRYVYQLYLVAHLLVPVLRVWGFCGYLTFVKFICSTRIGHENCYYLRILILTHSLAKLPRLDLKFQFSSLYSSISYNSWSASPGSGLDVDMWDHVHVHVYAHVTRGVYKHVYTCCGVQGTTSGVVLSEFSTSMFKRGFLIFFHLPGTCQEARLAEHWVPETCLFVSLTLG